MGSCADEVQVWRLFAAVVRAKPGRLRKQRLDGEGGAAEAVEVALKVNRIDVVLGDDVFLQIGQVVILEELHNGVAVGLGGLGPVGAGIEVRYRGEHVERLAAVGRNARVGDGRHVQVEGEVLGEGFLVEDVLQQAFVALAQNDVVVLQLGIEVAFLGAEVNHKQGHAVVHAVELAVGVLAAVFLFDEVTVGEGHIRVGNDGIGRVEAAVLEAKPLGDAVFDDDFVHFGIEVDFAAEIFDQVGERLHDGAGAAHSVVHPPLPLEVMYHGVDRSGVERITANQKRVEREAAAKEVILDKLRHIFIDALVGLQLDEIRRNLEHVGKFQEGDVGQLGEAFIEDGFGGSQEVEVTLLICRVALFDFFEGEFFVAVVVKKLALMVEDAVEGLTGDEFDVVFALAACGGEDVVEHKGGGNYGWTAVELETVNFIHISTATGFIALFKHFNIEAACEQSRSCAECAKTGANNQYLFTHILFWENFEED